MVSFGFPLARFVGIIAIELKLANFEIAITKRTISSCLPGQIIAASTLVNQNGD